MMNDQLTPRKSGGRRRDKVYNLIRRGGHHEHHRGERGGRRGGRGEKLHRLFEHGDLKRVLLALVAKKPSHGYELIKAIEEASSGLYVPSPGVIYPTLTLLEEQELLEAVPTGNGRKSYRLTAAGEAELAQHQMAVDVIFARLAQVTENREGNLAEGISDTMKQLKHTLRSNMMRTDLAPEQIAEVNQALQTAVAAITLTLAPQESAAEQPE
ncbi:PadR family transcriptional regulator [Chimaeribacter californicus]|uniref:PadR family transcriptional regulator n=1 Tax=Chimaeribacter californicus TaxID=2060067 RepID=A0A2N5EA69_9GAMM|nr:PadR family transcriptional regulator [Chimaeribacter californicus]PLR38814.1 PadR family transcriptional regulator [Chimaeribacter californicus]